MVKSVKTQRSNIAGFYGFGGQGSARATTAEKARRSEPPKGGTTYLSGWLTTDLIAARAEPRSDQSGKRNRLPLVFVRIAAALTFTFSVHAASPSPPSSADTIPIWNIPELRDRIDSEITELNNQLAALPALMPPLQNEAFGFHGGYFPESISLPETPRWTVDVGFAYKPQINQLILIPAIDRRFSGEKSYGFPRRFRIVQVYPNGRTQVAFEQLATDYPDPGRMPVLIDLPAPYSPDLRIEVFRGEQENGREFFALDEAYGRASDEILFGNRLHVNTSYESLPYWSVDYLIDDRTSLGLPLQTAQIVNDTTDYLYLFDVEPQSPCVIELDLGKNRVLGWIDLLPSYPPEGMLIPGYGFPKKLRVELVRETPNGRKEVRVNADKTTYSGNPGNNLVRLPGYSVNARWIRLIMEEFPVHDGITTLALGEVYAYRTGTKYPIKAIHLENFPPDAVAGIERIVDGNVSGRPVMSLADWFTALDRRKQLESRLEDLNSYSAALEQRWEGLWKGTGITLSVLLLLGTALIALLTQINKRQSLRKLRWQITRDLHDEVGSSLGGIAFMAEHLKNRLPSNTTQELDDLILLANEAGVSLREVVWVIDEETIRLPDLLHKLTERAQRILRDVDIVFEHQENCPNQPVSLAFKRHLVMIFKEAINNCVRHAHATHVQLCIEVTPEYLCFALNDNGVGFDPNTATDGWGLNSMKKRIQELGGELAIESAPGKGMQLQINIPLTSVSKDPNNTYKSSN